MATEARSEKRHIVRSPNYPAISLRVALAKAKLFLDNRVGRHAVGLETVAKIWDTSMKSSGFKLNLAAMRAFSLLENVPGGKEKMVRLSPAAVDILVDYPEGSPGQKSAIQRAALSPAIHAEMRERYGPMLPRDEEVRRYLVRERNFNERTVGEFIDEYKDTIAFAELDGNDKIDLEVRERTGNAIKVGDFVQWTSQGVERFPVPVRVVGLSENEKFAFVESENMGIPLDELTVQKITRGAENAKGTPPVAPPANPYFKTPSSSGPHITFPLSTTNAVDIRFQEPLTPEAYATLKRLIELSESALVDPSKRGSKNGSHQQIKE
jgi:hypothetical protein